MELKEVQDQMKSYLDDKKNPYFGSVIALWIAINKTLIFGICNFDKDATMDFKIQWIHHHFNHFKVDLWGGWYISGFYATVIYSILGGYVAMVLLNKINGAGKGIFIWANKSTINFLQKIQPEKWTSRKDYVELEKKYNTLEDEVKTRRAEVNKFEKDAKEAEGLVFASRHDQNELNQKISQLNEELGQKTRSLQDFIDEKNKFRVIYAKYGIGNTFVEVTKIVSDLLNNDKEFTVNNQVLGIDPLHFSIKQLVIEYEYRRTPKTFLANEEEIVTIVAESLVRNVTEKSQILQEWVKNTHKIGDIFRGPWILNYSKGTEKKSENVTINNNGEYFIDNKLAFYLLVTNISDGRMVVQKITLDRKTHSVEELTIVNNRSIQGKDSEGYKLEYKPAPK